ncbi:MAG: type II toxin-antitoxin system mRNA interferase toxin, RelE/StbE family [Candidatus Riflebacteria bacterium HGW-Riflebacteria-1]|jgi:mRNA interferase YafQ|nr:MAG: type II toxin-antitoxin system mRNA interferase toxin, RelE/StbE family [Candidatus Riflebacteria bacterium HGW-Riflebacteria-1]
MLKPVFTKQFEKDLKKATRRGKNIDKIKIIVNTLVAGKKLDAIHKDHPLIGNFVARRECHVESDWLLIYRITGDSVFFERTGSHSDLFG